MTCKCGGSFDEHDLCFECDKPKCNKNNAQPLDKTAIFVLVYMSVGRVAPVSGGRVSKKANPPSLRPFPLGGFT